MDRQEEYIRIGRKSLIAVKMTTKNIMLNIIITYKSNNKENTVTTQTTYQHFKQRKLMFILCCYSTVMMINFQV